MMIPESNQMVGGQVPGDGFGAPPSESGGGGLPAPSRLSALCGGNLLLVGLFIAGIACVYILSLRGGPQQASAEQRRTEVEVDALLQQFNGSAADAASQRKAKDVVRSFYGAAKQRQVPLDDLARNPFVFQSPAMKAITIVRNDANAVVRDPKAERQYEQMIAAVRELQLQSVLTGRTSGGSTAMISNNLLTKGQSIAGWTVSEIREREVVLTWQKHKHVLKIAE